MTYNLIRISLYGNDGMAIHIRMVRPYTINHTGYENYLLSEKNKMSKSDIHNFNDGFILFYKTKVITSLENVVD